MAGAGVAVAGSGTVSVARIVSRTNAWTCVGFTCTAIPSTGVSSAGVPVGIVTNRMSPPDIRPNCVISRSRFHPRSSTTCRVTASMSRPDRGRVGQRPGRQHPARHTGEERLLTGDAVEVTVLEAPALPDEGERVGPADDLQTGGEVDPGTDLALGPPQADWNAADGVGHLDEARQVDLRVVVDRDPGELLDGRDQRAAAGVAGPPVELRAADPLLLERGLRVFRRPAVG